MGILFIRISRAYMLRVVRVLPEMRVCGPTREANVAKIQLIKATKYDFGKGSGKYVSEDESAKEANDARPYSLACKPPAPPCTRFSEADSVASRHAGRRTHTARSTRNHCVGRIERPAHVSSTESGEQ